MAFGQVLQVPQDNPIFMREKSNNMYSTSAYFLAFATRGLLCTWFYPVLLTIASFYWFDF